MSSAIKSPDPEPAHHYLVRRTVEACNMAKEAAGAAAEGIATGSSTLLNSLRQRERELDTLDMEIDSGVTAAITEVAPAEAREGAARCAAGPPSPQEGVRPKVA